MKINILDAILLYKGAIILKTLSKALTSTFINNKIIEEYQREMCEYSLYIRFFSFVTFVCMLTIASSAIGMVNSIIFISAILLLRSRIGGYHAKSEFFCFLLSNLVVFFSIYFILPWIDTLSKIAVLMALSLCDLAIILLKPEFPENVNMGAQEIIVNRNITIRYVLIMNLIILVGLVGDFKLLNVNVILLSLIIVNSSTVVSKIIRYKKI